jgi:hypothetical protein
MKKMMFVLLLIVSIGILAAVESAPSAVVGYVKYHCNAGANNFVALPMNAGYSTAMDIGTAYPDQFDQISYWDNAVDQQAWVTAVNNYDGTWDGNFGVGNGLALMVTANNDLDFYSLGSMFATQAQYTFVAGANNTMMIPLNKSAVSTCTLLGNQPGVDLDQISYWDNGVAQQAWVTAVNNYDGSWDGSFDLTIGFPLMVTANTAFTWPPSPRGGSDNKPATTHFGTSKK